MRKSIKLFLEGKVAKIYSDDEHLTQEMFNNTAVFMGLGSRKAFWATSK
jgi:hypothetical protein